MASITTENFLCKLDQRAREPLQNMRKKEGDFVEKLYTLHLSQVVSEVINKFVSLFDSAPSMETVLAGDAIARDHFRYCAGLFPRKLNVFHSA